MAMDGALYDVESPLARGPYTLSPGSKIVSGSIAVGNTVGLLNYKFLRLRLANGTELEIVPRRIEHSADGPPVLVFDVVS
jgi:hypothetical protein